MCDKLCCVKAKLKLLEKLNYCIFNRIEVYDGYLSIVELVANEYEDAAFVLENNLKNQ